MTVRVDICPMCHGHGRLGLQYGEGDRRVLIERDCYFCEGTGTILVSPLGDDTP